jgi:hypothetical protein
MANNNNFYGGGGPYGNTGGGYAGNAPPKPPGGACGSASAQPQPEPPTNNNDWFSDQAASASYGQAQQQQQTTAGLPPSAPYGQTRQQQQQQEGNATPFYGQAQQQNPQMQQQNPQMQSSYKPYGYGNPGPQPPSVSSSYTDSAKISSDQRGGNAFPNSTSTGSIGSGGSKGSFGASPASTDDLGGLSGAIGGGAPMKGAVPGAPMSGNATGVSSYNEVDFENEPPLLEELGVNIPQILKKTKTVILPLGHTASIDTHLMDDDDLAGPLVYGLMLGGELLLSGKISFDVIYGFGLFGCLAMTLVINLMTPKVDAVSMWRVTSILGYCLIPVNVLAALNCFLFLKYRGIFGLILAGVTITWCTVASTRLFERSCDMRDQRYLIAYPIMLLYTSFVIITIF